MSLGCVRSVSLAGSKTGLSVSVVMSTGQNGWFFHVGATTTPLALSHFIFCSTLGRTLKGGEQNTKKSPQCTEKQSITCACGSSLSDAYSATCVFILEANKSVVGCASKMVSVS